MISLRYCMAALAVLICLAASQAQEPIPTDKAYLVVKLPAQAKLIIGSSETVQIGPERWFVSPTLPPGKTLYYELTAIWTENGEVQRQRKMVPVQAGKRSQVEFVSGELLHKPKVEEKEKKEPEKKEPEKETVLKSRTFSFTYAGAVKDLKPGTKARIWLPRPQTTPEQQVRVVDLNLPNASVTTEKQYGNKMFYFEAKADKDGRIPFEVNYQVTRQEVQTATGGRNGMEDKIPRFLQADVKVPVDGKPLELIRDKQLPAEPLGAAKVLYDLVNKHMEYRKDKPGWGQGDAVWACDSKFGNCTDFHSLFISLCRSQKIPARFEMGFSIPEKKNKGEIGGYHCWAWFHDKGKGWIPVDISEANLQPDRADYFFGNLCENRVQFTVGRDLMLEPRQDGKALNFLIYPYVEVDGQPYTAVERRFAFEDVAK